MSHKTGDLMIICSIHFPGRCDGLLQKIGSMNALLILARFRFQPMKETRVFSKYRSNYIFIELLSENVWTLQVRYQWLRAFLTCVLWCACYVLRLHTNSIATNATKLNFRQSYVYVKGLNNLLLVIKTSAIWIAEVKTNQNIMLSLLLLSREWNQNK